jgi:DNA polymerase elongation subunit (family B)
MIFLTIDCLLYMWWYKANMVRSIYLFSVQCISITRDPWAKKPVLFFVDENGRRETHVLKDYEPFVLIRPSNDCLEPMDVEHDDKIAHVRDDIIRIEEHVMTPLVGFTNNRKDRMFRVYYRDIGRKHRIMKALQLLDVTIVHQSFRDELLLLHITGWTLQKWYTCTNTLHSTLSIRQRDLTPDTTESIAPLSFAFIRIVPKSSTATSSNVFLPDHRIGEDVIQAACLRMYRIGESTPVSYCTIRDNGSGESAVIDDIRYWLEKNDPCIIVHISDPFDHLAYLHFRAKHNKMRSGLSHFPRVPCIENQYVAEKEFRDLSCPGRETVDILHILQKFMITPNLDGYTLPDAFQHPKLIRNKSSITFNGEIDVTLSSIDIRVDFANQEMDVMNALQTDNNFIVNNLALSSSCDLSLFQIISRGQQARAFACFARAYHNACIYINHTQFELPYVLVKKPRSESTFPDPLWIENPPIESLRGCCVQPTKPKKRRKIMTVLEMMGKTKPQQPVGKQTKKRFGGGFVIKPDPGLYTDPCHAVVTLDFASLYPSIMRGYRRCFMSVCYDERWLQDDRAEKEYVPLDDETCCVFIKSYDNKPVRTITDEIVADVMKNRQEVRAKIKVTTDPFLIQSLDAQQLCCKVLQNAFYGACGSETFGIPCTAIAASICMIGQWMNKTVRYRGMLRGGRCVYGDTDSVMFQLPTDPSLTSRDDILRDIYRQAKELEQETTSMFPPPNAVEFEAMKLPHLQTSKKKTYGAMEYPPCDGGWNHSGHELVKGFAIKKRDRCAFTQRIGKELLSMIFAGTNSDDDLYTWFLSRVHHTFHIQPTEEQLSSFIITCRLNTEYKQESVLALELADHYEKESGCRPRPGRRLRYVIVQFPHETRKHFQCAVTPTTFINNNHCLDAAYYLKKQLLLPIKQVLDLKPLLYERICKSIDTIVEKHMNPSRSVVSMMKLS